MSKPRSDEALTIFSFLLRAITLIKSHETWRHPGHNVLWGCYAICLRLKHHSGGCDGQRYANHSYALLLFDGACWRFMWTREWISVSLPMFERIIELNRMINAERDSGKISALLQQLRNEIAEEQVRIEARIQATQLSKLSTP